MSFRPSAMVPTSCSRGMRMTLFFSSCVLAPLVLAASPNVTPEFRPKDFPADAFEVTTSTFPFGALSVRITQAKVRKGIEHTKPMACRAWLDVLRDGKPVRRRFWPDFEAFGSSYGLFVPREQPSPDYFIVAKDGDYDGRTLLVGKDGSIRDLPGGAFFLTPDKRFLVSEVRTDSVDVAVFDLATRKMIIPVNSFQNGPADFQWYRDKTGVFATDTYWQESLPSPRSIYRLDLESKGFHEQPITSFVDLKAERIAYDVDPHALPNCQTPPAN